MKTISYFSELKLKGIKKSMPKIYKAVNPQVLDISALKSNSILLNFRTNELI